MNKKPKTVNKTKPRRTKGRVYQIDTYVPMPEVATPMSENQVVQLTKVESICDKARRLANEAEETKKRERAERELAFMKKMFETEDLTGTGVVMDKVREDGTIEYLICGRRWKYSEEQILFSSSYDGYLVNLDTYLGFVLDIGKDGNKRVYNLKDFGSLLQRVDKREAELRAKYPDNWWGRLKAKWA